MRSPLSDEAGVTVGSSTVSPAATRLTADAEIEVERVLQDVSARTGIERLRHERLLGVHAEHEDRDVAAGLEDAPRRDEAARAGHGAVHDDDARREAERQANGLVAVARFARRR